MKRILLDHGSGGRASQELIEGLVLPRLKNPLLEPLDDGAVFEPPEGGVGSRLAMTTDSYTVSPIFFPGGDIGSLAVHGTVNDLAMCGARPLYLSAGFILEEGFPVPDLERIVDSMGRAAREAGVAIVTGDTKVVERGSADQIFINTAGLGVVRPGVSVSARRVRPGDRIILSGHLADHGVTILGQREGLSFSTEVRSDSAALNGLVEVILEACPAIRCFRDPTRGGLATALNEIAEKSGVGMVIREEEIPIREEVRSACELLGLDPLYLANEGKLLAFAGPEEADQVLAAARRHERGRSAAIIGEVVEQNPGRVEMRTAFGTSRVVDMLTGEQLPRIC
jgi:hydrogenase expression/formation protein HypE